MLIIFYNVSFAQVNDYKTCEKLELINKLFENPDGYKSIIENSGFYIDTIAREMYNDSIHKTLDLFKEMEKLSRNFKEIQGNCIMTHCSYKDLDFYTYNFIGDTSVTEPSLTIAFKKLNNKWLLKDIYCGNSFYFFSETDSNNFKNNFVKVNLPETHYVYRTRSIFRSRLNYNYNYQTCEKDKFIRDLLDNPYKLDSILKISSFTKYNYVNKKNPYLPYEILANYLQTHLQSKVLWLNYPFPVHNQSIDEFINDKTKKDYFVVGFDIEHNDVLTIVFELHNSKWELSDIKKGLNICIGVSETQFIVPKKQKK
jgi:hypothetical protein